MSWGVGIPDPQRIQLTPHGAAAPPLNPYYEPGHSGMQGSSISDTKTRLFFRIAILTRTYSVGLRPSSFITYPLTYTVIEEPGRQYVTIRVHVRD